MDQASSIVIRVRRVVTEVAYVDVPLTEEIAAELGQPGKADLLVAEACRLAEAPETQWTLEDNPVVEVHPLQKPKPA